MTHIERYKEDVYNCLHCRLCTIAWDWPKKPGEWPKGAFQPTCPAGEKYKFEAYYGGGKSWIARAIIEGKIDIKDPDLIDILFACPTCGSCEEHCTLNEPKVGYNHRTVAIFEALRADAVNAGVDLPGNQKRFGEHIGKEHHPYVPDLHKDRMAWLPENLDLPEKAETVFYVGCTASYRQKEIAKATVEVLKKLGIEFTLLKDEWCCTSPLLRTGQWETEYVSAPEVVKHNIEEANKVGAKRIVATCAGCYRTWKEDYNGEEYKELLGARHNFEVLHTTQLIDQLIKEGKIKFKTPLNMKVTYHDPCHLGRHVGVYEEPRNILKAIPGIELIEMPRNRTSSWCCGSGGGVKAGYSQWAIEIATERVNEAEQLGIDGIVSACPFCERNISDAVDAKKSKLPVYDVIQLLNQSIS